MTASDRRGWVAACVFAVAAACTAPSRGAPTDEQPPPGDGPPAGADARADLDDSSGGDAGADGDGGPGGDAAAMPEVCNRGSFTAYFGNLHAHSNNSDGSGTPATAFTYARDTGHLDVFILTDHLEQLLLPGDPFWVPKWTTCRDAAAAATTATFIGLCGFEYGSGIDPLALDTTGHANVFFSSGLFTDLMLDFHEFYDELAACGTCWGQFNHPGESPSQTWNDWEYDAAAAARMTLFEMNGGGPTWDLLFAALDAGWRLSPSFNQDNHSADWGTRNDNRTGLWLSSLSEAEVERAIAARRTFSTEDRNASLMLSTLDGCVLGSQLGRLGVQTFRIEADDRDAGESFASLQLFGPGQTELVSHTCAPGPSCVAELSVDVGAVAYVLARAVQADGDVLVSGPIYTRP